MSKNDLLALLRDLDEATLRQRLAEIHGEQSALRVILRSLLARNREANRRIVRLTREARK